MDNRAKVQRLRQTRDYSFRFSDDNNLMLSISNATPGQPPLACNSLKPLTNKRVTEKIPSRMSLQRKPIIKVVHYSTQQLAGSNNSKGSQRPNDATSNPKRPVKTHVMTSKRVRDNISLPILNLQDQYCPKKRRLIVPRKEGL
ncbi:hypothetical protein DKX38_006286 [Salix brachista]|uniref:Uncharacterized protein n=1 Tax=Salix brachista TaxID=2182728 RepID=A0A5N5N1W0_9ROSI|nr:hypothetical protein DKX38_006286 [Salix brachista]